MTASNIATLLVLGPFVVMGTVRLGSQRSRNRSLRIVAVEVMRPSACVYSWFRPDMTLHRRSTHEEDELHGNVVVGVREQAADMAGEGMVDAVGAATAVAGPGEILQSILVPKGEADCPLLAR